ncbi:hypothetical protein GGX14DRAFT_387917 [Mycena pura]|uniref:Uncharacterized protein n=1 Tax=Mycena pura TaxID=153505 RepID=A0AAD7E1L3_9AGAR|nr:hypothetical protein GGX14DRAFT_387917 [Mycena pura]
MDSLKVLNRYVALDLTHHPGQKTAQESAGLGPETGTPLNRFAWRLSTEYMYIQVRDQSYGTSLGRSRGSQTRLERGTDVDNGFAQFFLFHHCFVIKRVLVDHEVVPRGAAHHERPSSISVRPPWLRESRMIIFVAGLVLVFDWWTATPIGSRSQAAARRSAAVGHSTAAAAPHQAICMFDARFLDSICDAALRGQVHWHAIFLNVPPAAAAGLAARSACRWMA